jgi:hypothetical protein
MSCIDSNYHHLLVTLFTIELSCGSIQTSFKLVCLEYILRDAAKELRKGRIRNFWEVLRTHYYCGDCGFIVVSANTYVISSKFCSDADVNRVRRR